MTSSLSNVYNRVRHCHPLRHPVSRRERSGSAGATFAVNDHLRSGGQSINESYELLKLLHCRRTEVLHGYVVPHITQSLDTGDVIARCLLLLIEQRNEHPKAVASQLFELGTGWVPATQQMRFVDPPCIHRRFCLQCLTILAIT